MHRILSLLLIVLITSCDSGVEWKDGHYQVQWIDTYENRKLGYVLDGGFWIPRIGKTIEAIGSDENYVVIKKYEEKSGQIEFYYIVKVLDNVETDLSPGVFGPYDSESFSELAIAKKLPNLSVEFK
ncbi:hypothetical protein [Rheinheimera sp.]|uniref:hypothetical protein n=1 Tax=Rheinheimera sp. TaxID=1869214 RepID=UPI004047CD9E